MFRTLDIILVVVMTAVAAVTYTLKHQAELKLEEVHKIEAEIKLEHDTIDLLRADWALLTQACADADIVVSDRRLPRGCRPRWLKLDRQSLAYTGGVAIYLGQTPYVSTVAGRIGQHPWAQ